MSVWNDGDMLLFSLFQKKHPVWLKWLYGEWYSLIISGAWNSHKRTSDTNDHEDDHQLLWGWGRSSHTWVGSSSHLLIVLSILYSNCIMNHHVLLFLCYAKRLGWRERNEGGDQWKEWRITSSSSNVQLRMNISCLVSSHSHFSHSVGFGVYEWMDEWWYDSHHETDLGTMITIDMIINFPVKFKFQKQMLKRRDEDVIIRKITRDNCEERAMWSDVWEWMNKRIFLD